MPGDRKTLARRAALLRLTARNLADSMRNGGFRSLYRGQGIEFDGVREYLRGDDVRSIDWNVTARMGKPFVKVFEEEHELQVFLIIDDSLSMNTGSHGKSRLATAHEAGALLTLAAAMNDSPVGAVFFDGGIRFSCVPKQGQDRMLLLLSKFDSIPRHRKNGSALTHAIKGAGKLLRKRSLVLVFSDFRTSGWEDAFTLLCLKNDVVAVRITDPIDEALPGCGSLPFIDSETGIRRILPTSVTSFRKMWSDYSRQQTERWKETCIRRGAVPLLLSTEDDPSVVLTNFFASRERQ